MEYFLKIFFPTSRQIWVPSTGNSPGLPTQQILAMKASRSGLQTGWGPRPTTQQLLSMETSYVVSSGKGGHRKQLEREPCSTWQVALELMSCQIYPGMRSFCTILLFKPLVLGVNECTVKCRTDTFYSSYASGYMHTETESDL